jgi:ABC-type proline/glycine betaine transport system permease subunit
MWAIERGQARMDWLTENKIPIDDIAEAAFDWLQINGAWFFDGLALLMERLIDAILWVLQTPHPLIIIALFAALTWLIQRNWKTVVFVVIGFLFILNQDYWEETTESLTLVLSACVVCMGVGVPIGIAAAHRPKLYRVMRPVLDLMQTLPTFVYLIPAIVFFGIGMAGSGRSLWRQAKPDPVEDRTALCLAADHDGVEPDHHVVAVDGGDCCAGGRGWFGRAGGART